QGLLVSFISRFTPLGGEIGLNGSVLAFTAAISILTGIAFGVVPAAPRRRELAAPLNQPGARTVGGLRVGVRNALIASQVALSFLLLVGAGLMIHSFVKLVQVDAGF